MNNYIDRYGRYHHKPVNASGDPSSNNGWIYTAYAAKLGLPIDMQKLGECFNLCRIDAETLVRNPGDVVGNSVPISRDEILGMVALGVLKPRKLSWNFSPYPLPRFSPLKLVKQLWELRPILGEVNIEEHESHKMIEYWSSKKPALIYKHRNYFWKNNLDQLYRFAFSVPLTDRHFILKKWNAFRWYNPAHLFYAAVAKIDSKLSGSAGIRFLKYGTDPKEMSMEFPEDHPIVQALK